MKKEYTFLVTQAFQAINACNNCGGNALFVVSLSAYWICVDCSQVVEMVAPEETEDPLLDVYRETIDKLG